MSSTRLLVLGMIRMRQPVHGYDVRRELLAWGLGPSANLKPGSIYGAMKTLEKDGCIAVHARETDENRPERTTYTITPIGEKEFFVLLRQGWWTVTPPTEPLVAPLSLMTAMPREELVAALSARLGQLEGRQAALTFTQASMRDRSPEGDGAMPDHVRDIVDFGIARNRAEIEWTRTLQQRLRDGLYSFTDEEPLTVQA